MVGIDEIVRAILAIARVATPVIINTARRNELVIKLLKKFQIDPDHPPADFTGVYRYALVEYGIQNLDNFDVEKLRLVLELFRQTEIHASFRKAFDRNDPYTLLSEAESYIDGFALGDKIRESHIDYQRELAKFSSIFMEIANRTRTPAEVLEFRKIEDLRQNTNQILARLENLNALEDLRQEIAKLTASEPDPILPAAPPTPRFRSEFARQLRNWLEALYDFESYEVQTATYFEWIINIRARRGFDRIVVRGIEGEVTISDVNHLRDSVDVQKSDEGWLVAPRRISQAAVDIVENDEVLFCYTFDELIDEVADFSRYIDWLEAEVKQRDIERLYVPLACTKEELDPITHQRIGKSRYDERNGWIDRYINRWLDDPAKEHISILGEFGTGKTWFALHYAWETVKKYRAAKEEGLPRPRLPLVIPLRDYAKAVSVESLFSEFFFRQHEIGLPGYSAFEQLNRMGKLLLIFDGFDEMAAKVDRQQMINNFWELAKVVVPGSKVILTCRTEHFPEAQEGRALLNAELKASTANLIGATPQFEVLEIEKLNSTQIREVISKRATAATVEKVMKNAKLLDLAKRPVMIELILEALPEIESGKPIDLSRIYFYAVRRKMERDIKTERTFTSMADKLYFLCELSWEMLSTDRMSLNFREFPNRLRRLFSTVVQQQKDLDHWHYDMMAQTMLIRNAEGDYTPAHRSLLEFFVAYKFAVELGILAPDFAEFADLQQFPPPSELSQTFGKAPLTQAVLELLLPSVDPGETTKTRLLQLVQSTQGQCENEAKYLGGNAVTLLLKVDPNALDNSDLRDTVILGADFTSANLRNVNLAQANLKHCTFTTVFGTVLSAAFSPDGEWFATGDANGEIYLWQVEGKPLVLCQGHSAAVWSVAVTPDGKTLVSGSDDGTVKTWDVRTGKCLQTLQGHSHFVRAVAVTPDGKTLVSGSNDRTLKLWNLETGNCQTTLYGHGSIIWSVAVTPDGQTIASGSADQTVKLWDVETGVCRKTLEGHTEWVLSVAITPDGITLASGSAGGTVKLWDLTTGNCQTTLEEQSSSVWSLAVAANGRTLIGGSADGTVKVWDMTTGDCLHRLSEHNSRVGTVAIAPDGRTLVSGSDDETVKLWDIVRGECLTTLQGYASAVWSLALAPDGNTLASGSADRSVKLWDLTTGECLRTGQGHPSKVLSVAIPPTGDFLTSLSDDGTLHRWDMQTGEPLTTQWKPPSSGEVMALSPDGQTLACGSADCTVKLWDLQKVDLGMTVLQGHTSRVVSLSFSSDSTTLVSGTDDGTMNLWDFRTGECLKTLQGKGDYVWALAVSPDKKTLASGREDGMVSLWDVETGDCLKTLEGHGSAVLSLVFHPNGKTLVSGSYDETIKVWELESGDCVRAIVNKPYAGMDITGATGLTEAQKATLKALGAIEQ